MAKLLVYYGEVSTRRRVFIRGTLYIIFALLWLMVFLILPSLRMAAMGFAERGDYGDVVWTFSLKNFHRLLGFGVLGWSSDFIWILLRSLWIGFVTTAFSVLLAYPVSFFIATRPSRTRYLWLALVVIPSCTNLVIRTFAWVPIFSADMPLAKFCQWLHILEPATGLAPSPFAVYVGMVSCFLPFTILPLYTSVDRLDWSIVEAANDLYAGKVRTFLHAILPQTLPGLSTAVILTFIPSVGVFVVPDLLGGAKYMLVGNLIQQQFFTSRDWPFGAVICFALMALTLLGLFLIRKDDDDEGITV
jgi:spermidine/putrescine transport system permease protein